MPKLNATRRCQIEWVFFIGAFCFLIGLGIWQVQRLAWKEALIEQIETAREEAPMPYQFLPNDKDKLDTLRFRFVTLTGRFLYDHELHMAARYYKGRLGYHLFVPLLMPDNRIAMVNRGWIPTELKERDARADSFVPNPQSLTVMVRTQSDRNNFTPINQPKQNIWFGRDIEEMEDATGLDLLPVTFDVVGEQNWDVLPIPSDGKIQLRNDHLSYAVTWFGIAIGWAVMFRIYRRRQREEG